MTTLREQMSQDMTLRGLSEKTQEAYLRTVSRLSEFYWRSPDRISGREAQSYLLHLHRERQLSHSTCNVAVSGLRFFYHVTLRRPAAFQAVGDREKVENSGRLAGVTGMR